MAQVSTQVGGAIYRSGWRVTVFLYQDRCFQVMVCNIGRSVTTSTHLIAVNREVKESQKVTYFIKSLLNFLMENLGTFTCDVIDGEGVINVASPVAGAVGGRVNAGSVESVGGGKVGGSPPFLVEGGVRSTPPGCVLIESKSVVERVVQDKQSQSQ